MVIVALIVPDWPSVGVSQSHPMTELGTTMQGAVVGIVVESSESVADPVTAPTATIWSETSTLGSGVARLKVAVAVVVAPAVTVFDPSVSPPVTAAAAGVTMPSASAIPATSDAKASRRRRLGLVVGAVMVCSCRGGVVGMCG